MPNPTLSDLRSRIAANHDLAPPVRSRPWSRLDDDAMISWRQQGVSWGKIGRRLQRTDKACKCRFMLLRSPEPKAGPVPPPDDSLLAAMLDYYDRIVDETGCSFEAAMERCGMRGGVAVL